MEKFFKYSMALYLIWQTICRKGIVYDEHNAFLMHFLRYCAKIAVSIVRDRLIC